jgi:hypothetical protein
VTSSQLARWPPSGRKRSKSRLAWERPWQHFARMSHFPSPDHTRQSAETIRNSYFLFGYLIQAVKHGDVSFVEEKARAAPMTQENYGHQGVGCHRYGGQYACHDRKGCVETYGWGRNLRCVCQIVGKCVHVSKKGLRNFLCGLGLASETKRCFNVFGSDTGRPL